jgi:hypothetical protein
VAIAIDDRSVQRQVVLSKFSSFEADTPKVDPGDATRERVKSTLGTSKGSKPTLKPTGEEATRDANKFSSSVFDSCFLPHSTLT